MSLYDAVFKDRINDPNGVNITQFLKYINYGFNSKLTGDSTILDPMKVTPILPYTIKG
jgi:hypothetical protein